MVGSEVSAVLASVVATYTPHLHHALGDWLLMALLFLLLAAPTAVARIRHERWRRRVLSAMR